MLYLSIHSNIIFTFLYFNNSLFCSAISLIFNDAEKNELALMTNQVKLPSDNVDAMID
jgi:hypothetical protein